MSLCIIASLRAEPALGAIYAFRTPFQDFANLTEGELFSADDSPLGISHPVVPVVALQGSLALGLRPFGATGPGPAPALGYAPRKLPKLEFFFY